MNPTAGDRTPAARPRHLCASAFGRLLMGRPTSRCHDATRLRCPAEPPRAAGAPSPCGPRTRGMVVADLWKRELCPPRDPGKESGWHLPLTDDLDGARPPEHLLLDASVGLEPLAALRTCARDDRPWPR